MLYGSVTCGSCYLIAALCLRQGVINPDDKKTVSIGENLQLLRRTNRKQQMGAVTTSMFFLYYFFYGTSYAKVNRSSTFILPGRPLDTDI